MNTDLSDPSVREELRVFSAANSAWPGDVCSYLVSALDLIEKLIAERDSLLDAISYQRHRAAGLASHAPTSRRYENDVARSFDRALSSPEHEDAS